MFLVAAFTCAAVFAGFGWGVLRFFRTAAGPSPRARLVAVLGAGFAAWHVWAIAASTGPAALAAAGAVLHLVAAALFWRAVGAARTRPLTAIFEADLPEVLVERGPFRYLRHPFYASYTLFWIAGALASASIVAAASVVVMLGLYVQGAREEEAKFARSPLAADYASYRRRVGALLLLPARRAARATGR